jgi:hypothetical protein
MEVENSQPAASAYFARQRRAKKVGLPQRRNDRATGPTFYKYCVNKN